MVISLQKEDLHSLTEHEWWSSPYTIPSINEAELLSIAQQLGSSVPSVLGRSPVDVLKTEQNRRRRILPSTRFSGSQWPYHIDTAHWLVPVRYIVLYCQESMAGSPDTLLISQRFLQCEFKHRKLAEAAQFVFGHGGHCFLSTIATPDTDFHRYDPGCMRPVDATAGALLADLEDQLASANPASIQWTIGTLAIVDNWRMLHARARANSQSERTLLRIYVK
jgi:alpha-ketoglutarate-dependent taurine dioxygenase